MGNRDHEHGEPIILNVNDDAVIANPVTPELLIDEWRAQRPRIVDGGMVRLAKFFERVFGEVVVLVFVKLLEDRWGRSQAGTGYP